jgi:hypothetical protein
MSTAGHGGRRVPSIRRVVAVSLLVDLLDIVTNLVVAVLTGSAVIFAEMAQGIADAIGSLLLVMGERRSRLPRDARYPSGHTREVFFWAGEGTGSSFDWRPCNVPTSPSPSWWCPYRPTGMR